MHIEQLLFDKQFRQSDTYNSGSSIIMIIKNNFKLYSYIVIMNEETMEEIKLDDTRMEECIICFDETDDFIVFICNHKTCNKCYPLIMEQRPNCPLCNKSLLPSTSVEITRVSPFTREGQIIIMDTPCKIFACICLFGTLICYILTLGGTLYLREK